MLLGAEMLDCMQDYLKEKHVAQNITGKMYIYP